MDKRCPSCEETKPVETGFHRLKSGPNAGKVQGWCKACFNAARKRRFAANPALRERARVAAAEHYWKNRERLNAEHRDYWARTAPERNRATRDRRFRKEYGITHDEFDAMAAAQGGVCAACGGPQQHGWTRLCVDHDHTTGRVRGLLCDFCNRAVGLLEDSGEKAARLAAYLAS